MPTVLLGVPNTSGDDLVTLGRIHRAAYDA
jgi:hypothetical protein